MYEPADQTLEPTIRRVHSLCPTLTTRLTLLQRIESGASVRMIAAELNVTDRTVRNRLRSAGIPLPSEWKTADVDLDAVLADKRAGMPVRTSAERHQVGETWVRRRVAEHGVDEMCHSKRRGRPRATPSSPTGGGYCSGWPTVPASTP